MRQRIELEVAGNEASDLLAVQDKGVLAAHRASRAFWTVLDEGPAEECLALLGQRADGDWFAHHQRVDAGAETGRTEDGESLAHRDGWVYVIGSHFGSKRGPLRPRRAFVGRFREADAAHGTASLVLVRNQFRLHRAINDALRDSGVSVIDGGEQIREQFLRATIDRGTEKGKAWVKRLSLDDLPINVEGAAFTAAGTLLLALRFPVSSAGEPLLVELSDIEGMFADEQRWPQVAGVYVLSGVTPPGTLTGLRALSARADGSFDAVVGSIDALDKQSTLLAEHPQGGTVTNTHVRFRLPVDGVRATGRVVVDLAPLHQVEGVAELDGVVHYVVDEDHRIQLFHT